MQRINREQILDLSNLYDIKTLSQAIADRGWACISQDKEISKSVIPTISADLQSKLNGCDFTLSWESRYANNQTSNYVCIDGIYYYFYSVNGNLYLYSTSDISVVGTRVNDTNVGTNRNVTQMIAYEQYIIFFDTITYAGIFGVYDTVSNTFHMQTSLNYFRNGVLSIVEDKLVCCNNNGWTLDLEHIWEEDLSTFITSYTSSAGSILAHFKVGDFYYRVSGGTLYYGTTISTVDTQLANISDATAVVKDDKVLLIGRTQTKIYNGTTLETTYTHTLSDIIGGNSSYYAVLYSGSIYIRNGRTSNTVAVSSDNGETWQDYTTTAFPTLTTTAKFNFVVNDNLVFLINGNTYTNSKTLTEYTDYIGSTSQVYYYNSTYKMKFAKNDTNKADIVSYLGYWNYWFVDTSTIVFPQNNNLWTMIYVGDDYIESSMPTGIGARLMQQAGYYKDNTSTSITFSSSAKVKPNTEYMYGELTALTLDSGSVDSAQEITTISFSSGATATTFTAPNTIKFSGDECSEGIFTPAVSSRYSIMFYTDGLSIQAVVKKSL